jgi:hypothetical protein
MSDFKPNRGTIQLRLDKRNVDIVARAGQSAGHRLNNIVDRYAFMVDTQRARVLGLFGEPELEALTLALKPVAAHRVSTAELKAKWALGLEADPDLRSEFLQLSPFDVIALVEALEGRSVNLNSQV